MKIKLGLLGGSGKMGQAVEQMLMTFMGKNEIVPYLFIGKKTSQQFAISADKAENVEAEVLSDVDVWIDFSSPEGLAQLLKLTEKTKTPVVSGTTGLTEKDFSNLKKHSQKRKIFWASNMSPGLWAFRQAMKGLSSISHFDFAVEEIHHTQKKDKPSGTAKTIHADLEKITNKKIETPISLRLGGVFGVHNVLAASSNEVITLQHQALNRTVFAEGALLAADWIVQQTKPGYSSMDDMLLKK
ncbi:MAG: 4-hydroxy-tetrahydrodipicolinate reductase [Pseudobdellovibrio sp.]